MSRSYIAWPILQLQANKLPRDRRRMIYVGLTPLTAPDITSAVLGKATGPGHRADATAAYHDDGDSREHLAATARSRRPAVHHRRGGPGRRSALLVTAGDLLT
jgi:hypothetical protein